MVSWPHCALNFPPRLQDTREDLVDARQDADDLKEYANAKLNRVTRYLGVLAERTRTLGLFPAHFWTLLSDKTNWEARGE